MSQQLIRAVASLGLRGGGPLARRGGPSCSGASWARPSTAATPAVVLVVAGVHGDEPSSVAAALELCRWLRVHPPPRAWRCG